MRDEHIYYYTDFNTFKLILENGTLRFKESTSSNDRLDSVQLFKSFESLAKEKLKSRDEKLKAELKFLFEAVSRGDYSKRRLSLVACFTRKKDSRMLWDAYTMHRKDRSSDRYNGVCIEFNASKLVEEMENAPELFDYKAFNPIEYGFENIETLLMDSLDEYAEAVQTLSKDDDQSQTIIPTMYFEFLNTKYEIKLKKCIVYPFVTLMSQFDTVAPFFKHSFWREEEEVRALLSVNEVNSNNSIIGRYEDGSRYFDLDITADCIKGVILGPECSEKDVEELEKISGKISFGDLRTVKSEGTGVLINR